MSIRILLMLAGCAAAVWSMLRWRSAVKVAVVLLIFEGALRKWVFPGAQDLVYFAKDVFLLGAYLGFLQRGARQYRPPAAALLYFPLAAAAALGLFQIFNPNLPNLLVGVFGFKAYFFYVPLLFVVPAAFGNDRELYRFLRRYSLIAIPVGLLAVAQFFSPSSSLLNTYAWSASDAGYIATFGSSTYVRATGTFSFITGFTSYLTASAILLLVLLGHTLWKLRGNLLVYTAFGLTLLGMLMSGSRGPVLTFAVLFPLYWWLGIVREGRGGATSGRLVLGLGLVAIFLSFAGDEAINAFYGRAMGTSDVKSRLSSPLNAVSHVLPTAGLTGLGIGATHQTAAAVTKGIPPYSWLRGQIVEPETGRILLETGAPGFLLMYLIRLYLPLYALYRSRTLRTPFHRALATASFLFLLSQIPGTIVFDVTAGFYYWFFAGLLMCAIKLDQQAVVRAQSAAAAAPVPGRAAPSPSLTPGMAWQRRNGPGSW